MRASGCQFLTKSLTRPSDMRSSFWKRASLRRKAAATSRSWHPPLRCNRSPANAAAQTFGESVSQTFGQTSGPRQTSQTIERLLRPHAHGNPRCAVIGPRQMPLQNNSETQSISQSDDWSLTDMSDYRNAVATSRLWHLLLRCNCVRASVAAH